MGHLHGCTYSQLRGCKRALMQFALSLAGNLSDDARQKFWDHCSSCDAWRDHPVFHDGSGVDFKKLVPIVLHIDGAEVYRTSEYHILSWSSMLSALTVADVSDKKFLSCALPHEIINRSKEDRYSVKFR